MQKIGDTSGLKKIHRTIAQEAECVIDQNAMIEQQILMFHERLVTIIRPRNQSDRTSFRRVSNWLLRGIQDGAFKPKVLETVLRYAQEATSPDCRNPAAVFMAILKKEMGYASGV